MDRSTPLREAGNQNNAGEVMDGPGAGLVTLNRDRDPACSFVACGPRRIMRGGMRVAANTDPWLKPGPLTNNRPTRVC
jgi:hypothetical protein